MNRLVSLNFSRRFPAWPGVWLIGLSFLHAIAREAGGAAVIRGPYLQQGTPTNLIVRWRTDTAHIGRVRYGDSATNLSAFADELASTTNHVVLLTNLAPDTVYFYSPGLAAQTLNASTNYFFRTAPLVGSRRPFRVWVLGDFGFTNATSGAVPVRDAYSNFTSNRYTDLWLMLGDNAYYNGSDAVWQIAVFHTYSNILCQTPVWSCIGNQETFNQSTVSNTAPYFENFTFPTNAEAGGVASGTERYFSFDYANVHFICLDSMSSARTNGSPMLLWLEADLQQNTQEWTVAFWHHPPYSKGSRDSDLPTLVEQIEMRTNAVRLLESYGVDLVLSGHSHSYERSYLIDGHYGLSSTFSTNTMLVDGGSGRPDGDGSYDKPTAGPAAHEGTVYLVSGNGADLRDGPLNHPVMYRSRKLLGSVVLDFEANRLDAKSVLSTGVIDDYFTMTKGASPLRILAAQPSGTDLLLSWQTIAQRTYRIQYSPVPGPPWTNLAGPFTGDGAIRTVPIPMGATNGFLRLSTPGD